MKKWTLGVALSFATAVSLQAAVYATVDGEEVTDQDIQVLMQAMPQQTSFHQLPDQAKAQVINQAVERKLLTAQAKKDGIEKDPAFLKALAEVKDEIALEIWMKNAYEATQVTEAQMKKFYEDNKARFVTPPQVKARHILVREEEAAKSIIAELKGFKGDALTQKFSALASEKSLDSSNKQKGGDLDWFAEGQMVKPFSDAAFALEPGQITATPVQTQFGYHVILNEDEKGSESVSFDKAKAQIRNMLKMEAFRESVSAKAKALREIADVKIK
jgi:parvulin-like peptidyl-prolyl isomerase